MEDLVASQVVWATILVGGVLGILVLTKTPEMMIAALLVGQDFIQFVLRLLGFTIERRTFATAGAVIFLPVVVLFLILHLVGARGASPIIGRRNALWVILTVVLGLLLVAGLTYTDAPVYGERKTRDFFVFGVAPMLLAFTFIRDAASARRLLAWFIMFGCAMTGLVSLYAITTRGSLEGTLMFLTPGHGEQLGAMEITGHGALSSDVVIAMIAVLTLAAAHRGGKWKILPIIVLPIAAFFVFHAGTRSNLVAFIATTLIGGFFVYRDRLGIFVVVLVFFALLAGLLVVTADPDVQGRMLSSWIAEGTASGAGGADRIEMLSRIPGYFFRAPVFGSGTGNWPVLEFGLDAYAWPHNMFAEILAENGLIGLAVLLSLWFVVIQRVIHLLRTAEVGTWLYGIGVLGVCLIIFEFFVAIVHFGIAHPSSTMLLSLGIIMRCSMLVEAESDRSPEADAGSEVLRGHLATGE